jgi:hypothetical protein
MSYEGLELCFKYIQLVLLHIKDMWCKIVIPHTCIGLVTFLIITNFCTFPLMSLKHSSWKVIIGCTFIQFFWCQVQGFIGGMEDCSFHSKGNQNQSPERLSLWSQVQLLSVQVSIRLFLLLDWSLCMHLWIWSIEEYISIQHHSSV